MYENNVIMRLFVTKMMSVGAYCEQLFIHKVNAELLWC